MHDTGVEVLLHQSVLDARERVAYRGGLGDDVNAVGALLQHILEPAHLSLDNLQPPHYVLHAHHYIPPRGIKQVYPQTRCAPLGYTECTMSPVFASVIVLIIGFGMLRMQPRRFYFIRHGETVLNEQHIRQGEEGSLSLNGRNQAEEVGIALSRVSITRIVASTYPRTRETALIIKKHLRVPIVYSALLAERKNPKEIIGKPTRDPDVMRIVDEMDLAYHDDDYRFSDEESFIDLKKRARKCLALLALQGARETAVVTHHVFLKMLIAYMLYREQLHAADFIKLSFFNVSDNAGISVCEFHPWKIFSATRGWEVVTYNQQPS